MSHLVEEKVCPFLLFNVIKTLAPQEGEEALASRHHTRHFLLLDKLSPEVERTKEEDFWLFATTVKLSNKELFGHCTIVRVVHY